MAAPLDVAAHSHASVAVAVPAEHSQVHAPLDEAEHRCYTPVEIHEPDAEAVAVHLGEAGHIHKPETLTDRQDEDEHVVVAPTNRCWGGGVHSLVSVVAVYSQSRTLRVASASSWLAAASPCHRSLPQRASV